MAVAGGEDQLELFDVRHPAPRRPRRETLGRWLIELRYDQLVLTSMAGVIGLTVVFACGVERGKQLVRAERALLVRQHPGPPERPPERAGASPTTASPSAADPAAATTQPKPVPAPATAPKVKAATKYASADEAGASIAVPSGALRYAIQVVTYSRLQSARHELERLRARGERAFLVMRDGRTRVYVGPFPSKANAAEKLTMLKVDYHDCFVRAL